jgi:nucleotide-binding universal stress UspA family protein
VTHPAGPARSDAPSRSVGLNRILIAYDFSADSELALNNGLSLALEFNAELHLLHVLSNTYRALESAAQQSQDEFGETGQRLRRVLPREAALGRDLKIALRKGPVYREVLNYADDRKVDLICMGASGSGYGMHALFGSNSDRVVRQARCPILIARPLRPA